MYLLRMVSMSIKYKFYFQPNIPNLRGAIKKVTNCGKSPKWKWSIFQNIDYFEWGEGEGRIFRLSPNFNNLNMALILMILERWMRHLVYIWPIFESNSLHVSVRLWFRYCFSSGQWGCNSVPPIPDTNQRRGGSLQI